MAPRESRKYDIVLLGATGYTGALTAEHLARHAPTDLRWALAGRSQAKLDALATKLKGINPDRPEPSTEVISIDDREALHALMGSARVCISIVSYWSVGALVVEACVESGTDYLDAEGDTPTLREWFDKYHDKAAANGVRLIHACAMHTAPHDLLTWVAVRDLADRHSTETEEVIMAIEEARQEASGGTVESIAKQMAGRTARAAEEDPWYLSPRQGAALPATTPSPSGALGVRHDARLGALSASSFGAPQNRAIVHRTWGLLTGLPNSSSNSGSGYGYGPGFRYTEYEKAGSAPSGALRVAARRLAAAVIGSGPLFALARRLLPAEGDGPDVDASRRAVLKMEVHAVAAAAAAAADGDGDGDGDGEPRRVRARLSYAGGPYLVTALFLAEGAVSLLLLRRRRGEGPLEGGVGGGCLTPAMLGAELLGRARKAGVEIDVGDV